MIDPTGTASFESTAMTLYLMTHSLENALLGRKEYFDFHAYIFPIQNLVLFQLVEKSSELGYQTASDS
jgi:hypothetical protein